MSAYPPSRPYAGRPDADSDEDAWGRGAGAHGGQPNGQGAWGGQQGQGQGHGVPPAPWGPPQAAAKGGWPSPGALPPGSRPGFNAPAYGVQQGQAPQGARGGPSLPPRRPAPGYEVPPDRPAVPYDPEELRSARGGRFAHSSGVPAASAPSPRRKPYRPFDLSVLEPVSKDTVLLWKSLEKSFPAYFRTTALVEACFEFLSSLLAPKDEQGRALTLEVKRRDDGSVNVKELTGTEVTIGSHAQNSVQLHGASLSRRHVRIVHDERGYNLVDQGSSNGTWLRGERLQPGYAYPLKSGDAFTVPGYEIHARFEERGAAPVLRKLHVAALSIETGPRLAESVPVQAQVAIVRLEPANVRAFIEVDLPLAQLAVARVLGSPTASAASAGLATPLKDGAPPMRPLTEVEKGVLELIFVKLLDAAQSRWGADAELTFHLEALVDGKDARVARTAAGVNRCVVAKVGLEFDTRKDTVRVALPDAAIAGLAPRFASEVARAGEHGLELVERFRDLTALAEVELSGSVGRAFLTRAELAACSPGDVFVPDELTIGVEDGKLTGKVELRVLTGRGRAKVVCELRELSDERVVVEVAAVEVAPHGRAEAKKVPGEGEVDYEAEAGADEGEGGLSQEEIAAAAGLEGEDGAGAALLDDVPLPLVVELGRVSMTVRELAALRKGQVIELGHDPKDPVSLVFEGHVIGAGKLVNVEGEIGVQITTLGR